LLLQFRAISPFNHAFLLLKFLIAGIAGGGLEKGSKEWKRQQRRQTAARALEILANVETSPIMPPVRPMRDCDHFMLAIPVHLIMFLPGQAQQH
jgi:hypothetical protein